MIYTKFSHHYFPFDVHQNAAILFLQKISFFSSIELNYLILTCFQIRLDVL